MTALFEYLVENASLWDAGNVTERLIAATERQMDSSRLYETDERYGEGGHRISLLGQHVLFEVNDKAVVSISCGCWPASEAPIYPLSRLVLWLPDFPLVGNYCFNLSTDK